VPGLIAAQHSGSGKANQYFLRGFNLDHGTDFTTYIDDVPMNLRTHGHGQGYLDVNGLIPEVVERVDYRKGPYRADVGDFALAGAAFMSTIERLNAPFVALEGGQYGWQRVAGGATTRLGDGDLTVVGQWKTYDGPWELPEDLEHESIWSKYARETPLGALELTLPATTANGTRASRFRARHRHQRVRRRLLRTRQHRCARPCAGPALACTAKAGAPRSMASTTTGT
jgi:outer membrane cobalamin receptor